MCIPFWVTLTLTLTSGPISRFFFVSGAYLLYISANFPQMCLMLVQFFLGIRHVTVTSLGVISPVAITRRKDEITSREKIEIAKKNATRNNEKTPSEMTKNKSSKRRYFSWRFFCYFVFSPGVFSLFFAWRFFDFSLDVISSFNRAITPCKKTKNEITKWHKPAPYI